MSRAQVFALLLGVTGCGTDEPLERAVDIGPVGFDAAAQSELEAAGLGKYLGRFTPSEVTTLDDTTEAYSFEPDDDGPVCLFGDPFRVSVREGQSDDLLIFLQGGGACWSELCGGNQKAGFGVLPIAWTDPNPESNPPLARFNVVFVSYCDGSVFSGDNLIKAADGSIERRHRGVANFSAALDVAKMRFPHPRRIALAGTSAGGYGTILGTELVRLAYPETPLYVMNDAGIGLTNPSDPSIFYAARDEWKALQFLPASCGDCVADKQFTGVIGWALDHDPSLRVAAFSAYQDGIIGGVFLNMEATDFEALLLEKTGALHAAHPDRYERFFVEGGAHTAVLAGYYDLEVGGERLVEWIGAMLKNDPDWDDRLQ